MLPLIVMPGAGSELYRGLGSVVVGGLALSDPHHPLLTPLVFSYVIELVLKLRHALVWLKLWFRVRRVKSFDLIIWQIK